MPKLEGIFFDLDDTLYSSTHFAIKARRNSCKKMIELGLKYDEEKLFDELSLVIDEFTSNHDKHFNKLLLRIPKEAWAGHNPEILVAAAVVGYHNTKMKEMFPYEDAIDLLQRLQKTNIVRGIITAGFAFKQAEKIVRLGLLKYMSHGAIFISEQVGFTKANPRIFSDACDKLGINPKNTMYVGDKSEVDIDIPNSISMITVLHKRKGKYLNQPGKTEPTYVINNFYDLMDILQNDFDIPVLS